MDTLEPVHQLQSDDYNSLNLELALLETLFELLQVDPQQLHHQIVVIGVRAVGIESREPNTSIFGSGGGGGRLLWLVLLGGSYLVGVLVGDKILI